MNANNNEVFVTYRGVKLVIATDYFRFVGASASAERCPPEGGTHCREATYPVTVGHSPRAGRLRKRLLREARRTRPDLPDDAVITTSLTMGFEYRYVDRPGDADVAITAPVLYAQIGRSRRRPWREHKALRYFSGVSWMEEVESAIGALVKDGVLCESAVSHGDIDDLLDRALDVLHDPPTAARGFPSAFQKSVVERYPREWYQDDFDHTYEDCQRALASLGVDARAATMTYGGHSVLGFAADSVSVQTLIRRAVQDDHPDVPAELLARYRRALLTPHVLMLSVVPAYRAALSCLSVYTSVKRSGGLSIEFDEDSDLDGTLEEIGVDPGDSQVRAALDTVSSAVESALEEVAGWYAREIEKYSDYSASYEGQWDNLEGCDDLIAGEVERYIEG